MVSNPIVPDWLRILNGVVAGLAAVTISAGFVLAHVHGQPPSRLAHFALGVGVAGAFLSVSKAAGRVTRQLIPPPWAGDEEVAIDVE